MKPCPFCGGKNIDYQTQTEDREGVPTNAICQDCGACGPLAYEINGGLGLANNAWNKRGNIPELREVIAREIMEQFWGILPSAYSWEKEAAELRVDVSDSEPSYRQTVIELTDQIVARISE